MDRLLLGKAFLIGVGLVLCGSSAFASTGLIHEGKDFASLLKSPSLCTSTNDCPAGAYFVTNSDGAAALYKLGTLIGGSQNGATAGLTSQWSPSRYAILIEAGQYNMVNPQTLWPQPFKIGYYTQIMGVAQNREDVVVSPGINSLNDCNASGTWGTQPARCTTIGGLNNFWRSLSNLTINSADLLNPEALTPGQQPQSASALRFAISQAAPIRNVHFEGLSGVDPSGTPKGVLLCDWYTGGQCGYTSGGFIFNSVFSGVVNAGSQQQFYISHSNFTTWLAGTWNMVSVDNTGQLMPTHVDPTTLNPWSGSSTSPSFPFTRVNSTVAIASEPRLIYTPASANEPAFWSVNVGDSAGTTYPISDFTVVTPGVFSSQDIAALNQGLQTTKGIIFMPGVYDLQDVLQIPNDKIVLGIGIPSLQCNSASGACMTTGSEGVRLAGLTFDAGTNPANGGDKSPANTLLTIGVKGAGSVTDPDVLQDVYCRIARTDTTMSSPSAYSCLTINANNTIGQNLWLWRGDHDAQSGNDPNPANDLVPANIDQAQYGLIVNGNNVTMNALFVEHFLNYQTVWNGQDGTINFYQSEMPYLLPQGDQTTPNVNCATPDGTRAYTAQVCPSLYISGAASGFVGRGLGIYSYFAQQSIQAKSAIEIGPDASNIYITHAITRWLNGVENSGINSIIQDSKGTYPVNSLINGQYTLMCRDNTTGAITPLPCNSDTQTEFNDYLHKGYALDFYSSTVN